MINNRVYNASIYTGLLRSEVLGNYIDGFSVYNIVLIEDSKL